MSHFNYGEFIYSFNQPKPFSPRKGTPSAPNGVLEVIELMADSVTLQWKTPLSDGGSAILRYIVEKRFTSRGSKWAKVASNVKPQGLENKATIRNLDVGVACEFRVFAVNDVGEGEPLVIMEAVIPGSVKGQGKFFSYSSGSLFIRESLFDVSI